MKRFHKLATVPTMALMLLFSGTAMGAGTAAEQNNSEKQNHQLGSVTVTAQKTEEKAQEVPVSITVLDELAIDDRGIESILDVADYVPNLTVFANGVDGMNTPSMRGMHAEVTTFTVTTGMFMDGIPILNPCGYDDALVDIERVEVLRGPQGTLYGKSTETGVINIITKQPGNEYRAKAAAELGTDQKRQVALNFKGPIVQDKLFIGLAGKWYEKEGFIDNTYLGGPANDKRHWYGKAHLRWTPVEALDISLLASILQYDNDGNNMSLGSAGVAAFGMPPFPDRQVACNFRGKNKANSSAQSLKIAYDLTESLKLTSVTTRRVFDDDFTADYDFSPATLQHNDKDNKYTTYSQELRLNSSGERLKWLAGLYYDDTDNEVKAKVDSDIPFRRRTNDRETMGNAYAAFGQASYLFPWQMRLVLGLRYETQDMEFEDYISGAKLDGTWDDISPKVALEYIFNPQVMTYVSASKGYRSGGFNTYATDQQYYKYDEEKLWSYELGVKNTLLDKRLMINAAVFYMNIDDMQVSQSVPTETSQVVTNAGKASATGCELEVRAIPLEGLTLSGSVGYTDIKFDEFSDTRGDYEGNHNPYAPEYTFNLGAQYRHPKGYFARADLIGYGKMYFDKNNNYSRDPYEVVNVRVGYETERFDVYLYGKNVFDTDYTSYGYYGGYYTLYSEPAEFGVKLVYRF